MSKATFLLKTATAAAHLGAAAGELTAGLGNAVRAAKGVVPTVLHAGADVVHRVGDVGQAFGELAGINPELARAGAQAAGLAGTVYGAGMAKDRMQQKIDAVRYQMQGQPQYY